MYRTSYLTRQILRTNKLTSTHIVSRSLVTENQVLNAFRNNNFSKRNVTGVSNRKSQNILFSISFQCTNYSTEPSVAHVKVALPALSPTMEKGSVVRWLKSVGDRLEEGDLLAEIETDKATMGFETPDEGYLAAIFYPAGSKDIEIGKLICIVVENESDIAAFKDYSPSSKAKVAASVSDSPTAAKPQATNNKQYPDHLTVNLPALSPTMETGSLHGWQKEVGDRLEEGDVLVQIETDKATMDFETPDEGYLAKILIPAGQTNIPIGTLLCIIVSDKSDVEAFNDYTGATPCEITPSTPVTPFTSDVKDTPTLVTEATPVMTLGGRIIASPLARRKALDKKIDLQLVSGSGPGGRITADDVTLFTPTSSISKPTLTTPTSSSTATPLSTANYNDLPTSNIRQVIAKRLLESKTTIPHYYLSIDVDTSKLMKLRSQLNKTLESDKVKLSVNDFIVKASALACQKVPEANSSWQDSFIRQYKNVDINVAVATDSGLITPIVFNANHKGLTSINSDVARLATKAREGTLQPQEFIGGTFTISNLGMFGIKNFSAIINPPQACILAIGGTQVKLIADSESENGVKETTIMSVTMSCDHRVVDGAVGALWLKQFKSFIENPQTMLL